jgi:hypothetical protein
MIGPSTQLDCTPIERVEDGKLLDQTCSPEEMKKMETRVLDQGIRI